MSTSERRVRLIRHRHNQALRVPREFELEGDRLIVEPIRKGRLPALPASLAPLTEPIPDIVIERPNSMLNQT